jgi:mannosyl-oligosaccharide glucosidase
MPLPFLLLACLFTSLAATESIDKSLLWGPYRPNLYFGIRPRIPTGPIFGLLWGSVEDGKLNPQKLRHTCEQGDGINSYGWTTYDARNGGVQTISDPENALNLTVEFVKFPSAIPSALDYWSVRVKGTPFAATSFVGVENWNMSVIFYIGIGEQDDVKEADIRCSSSVNGTVGCQGNATGLGEYSILLPPPQSRGALSTTLKSTTAAKDRIWEANGQYFHPY